MPPCAELRTGGFAAGQQFAVARIRGDHARAVRMKEIRDGERALVVGQRVGAFESNLEVTVARLIACKRLELHEQ